MFTKKGQLQINETILVIFIFTIMVVIGFVLFNRWTRSSIESEFLDNERIRFSNMLTTFAEMPEIRCSSQGADLDCVDTLKLLAFNGVNYRQKFGFKEIRVKVVYPETSNKLCDSFTYPDCNEFLVYSNKPVGYEDTEIIQTPVSLYYAVSQEYKIGLLEIKWLS